MSLSHRNRPAFRHHEKAHEIFLSTRVRSVSGSTTLDVEAEGNRSKSGTPCEDISMEEHSQQSQRVIIESLHDGWPGIALTLLWSGRTERLGK